MNVTLVGPEIEENLSIRYLAAALEESGHYCRITPFRRRDDLGRVAREIVKQNPDLVGLSLVFQTRSAEFFDLVEVEDASSRARLRRPPSGPVTYTTPMTPRMTITTISSISVTPLFMYILNSSKKQ